MSRALAAALLGLVLAACGGEETPPGTATLPVGREGLPPPDQVVENGEHVITVDGVKKAVLVAEQLYFFNETGTVVGDTIQVNFFGEGGEFVSMLTARTGEINQRTQEMVARGEVNVRGTDATIESSELFYDPAGNRVYTNTPTVINQRGNVIRGQGVEADPGLERIQIRGGSAVLRDEPELGPSPPEPTEPDVAPPDVAPPDVAPPAGGGGPDGGA